ncbi:MAG: hypothetical protein KGI59_02965 [Patescibacteria group bacterium]|nr:hypothetical protein [Patescibacteria group bacterium]MDE2172794.1 hypothetical protein [Patescibacteria group bacterium]
MSDLTIRKTLIVFPVALAAFVFLVKIILIIPVQAYLLLVILFMFG